MALLDDNFRNVYICQILFQLNSRVKAPFPSQEGAKADQYWTLQTTPPQGFCVQILLSKYSYEIFECSVSCVSTSLVITSQKELRKLLFIGVPKTFRWLYGY